MVGKVAVTNHPAISALTLLRQVHAVVSFSGSRRVEENEAVNAQYHCRDLPLARFPAQ